MSQAWSLNLIEKGIGGGGGGVKEGALVFYLSHGVLMFLSVGSRIVLFEKALPALHCQVVS